MSEAVNGLAVLMLAGLSKGKFECVLVALSAFWFVDLGGGVC